MPVLGMGVPNRNVRIGAPKPHTRMFGLLRMTPKLGTTQASIAVERPGLELPRGNENAPSAAPRRTAGCLRETMLAGEDRGQCLHAGHSIHVKSFKGQSFLPRGKSGERSLWLGCSRALEIFRVFIRTLVTQVCLLWEQALRCAFVCVRDSLCDLGQATGLSEYLFSPSIK